MLEAVAIPLARCCCFAAFKSRTPRLQRVDPDLFDASRACAREPAGALALI
jgi:hypothetical protein